MSTATKRVREELEDLAERVAVAEAEARSLSIANGYLYRKWHTAESRVKRLEAGERTALDRVIALADEADARAGAGRHDSISGRVTTRDLRRVITKGDGE